MKTTHRIALGVALLAAAAVFIWKDSIPFLSSSALISSGQKEFRMQIPTGYTQEMYAKKINDIILTKYPECLAANGVSISARDDVLTVRFDCLIEIPPTYPMTSDQNPEITISQTTSPGVTEEIVTTEISPSSDSQ